LRKIVGKDIYIIEDCAQSHGASMAGSRAGLLGDLSAFSFFPSKNLGAYGDAGMVLTNNELFANSVRSRRTFGMKNKDVFLEHGINSRLDELQAAILRVKLPHLEAMNARRNELASRYAELLNPAYLRPQKIPTGVKAVHHVYSCKCARNRDQLVDHLERNGIQTNVYYASPISDQEAYKKYYSRNFDLPVARELTQSIIALPFHAEMDFSTVEHIAAAINQFFTDTK
jgi:dTDP-4-amino-4,6-dideoxygalactose transaminase